MGETKVDIAAVRAAAIGGLEYNPLPWRIRNDWLIATTNGAAVDPSARQFTVLAANSVLPLCAEVERLRADALIWHGPNGPEVLSSAEEVIARRKEAAAELVRLREVERLALTLVTASATARDCAETFMRRRRVEESPPLSVCHEWPEHAAMTAAWAAEREAMSALTAAVRR